ncbi:MULTISPECIES: ABC transporter substrate-binding protein [unclassified Embleya]|uniref:ABC transporter substrate-binding protein n=1 Tax=unclassified Embleya TaxID=2699296 RepID=UPI0033EBED46
MPVDYQTLDPTAPNFTSMTDYTAARAIMDPLFDLDRRGNLVPVLALSATSSDADRTFTVALRENVRFSDGTPLDAQAVVDHYKRLQETKTCLGCDPRVVTDIASLSTAGTHTVVFHLTQPWAKFPVLALTQTAALIPSPTAVRAQGDNFGRAAVGAGAYRLERVAPGSAIILVRNDTYWRPEKANLDKILIKIVPDTQSAVQSVQSGTLDMAVATTPTLAEQARGANLQVQLNEGFAPEGLNVNTKRPGLDDARVRAALSAAIDRKAINKAAYGNGSKPALALLADDNPAQQGIAVPDYDPAAARRLLAEYGKPVSVDILAPDLPAYLTQALLLQQMWKDVGVDAKVTAAGPTLNQAIQQRNFDVLLGPFFVDTTTVSGLQPSFVSGGFSNLSGYANPHTDALFAKLAPIADDAQALSTAREIVGTLAREVPVIPVVRKMGMFIGSDRVHLPPADSRGVDIFSMTDVWLSR